MTVVLSRSEIRPRQVIQITLLGIFRPRICLCGCAINGDTTLRYLLVASSSVLAREAQKLAMRVYGIASISIITAAAHLICDGSAAFIPLLWMSWTLSKFEPKYMLAEPGEVTAEHVVFARTLPLHRPPPAPQVCLPPVRT